MITTRMLGGTRHLRALTAALCTALPLWAAAAQSEPLSKDVIVARVDSMAREYMVMGPVSMSIAVSRGDEALFQRAYGVADFTTKRPVTTASRYNIGTVSAQFTAALVLKQVDRGRIALTDSIGSHLTAGLRPEWRSLTIEQLLNHTAGLPPSFKREGSPETPVSTETMIAWAARDTMRSAPGTRFAPSHVGYLLLAALVEKLSGKSYDVALRDEIARPLGLRTLGWCAEPGKDTLMTTGHEDVMVDDRRPTSYVHPSRSVGTAGLCVSAGDLNAWNRALHGGRVLSPASYAAMTTPRGAAAPLNGFGLRVQKTPPWGLSSIFFVGAGAGFLAENAWFPAEPLSVTVLHNSFGAPAGFPFSLEIARAISTPPPPPLPTAPPPSDGAIDGSLR